jgi:hypothetical protein
VSISPQETFFRLMGNSMLNLSSGWFAIGLFSVEMFSYYGPARLLFIGVNIGLGIACFVLAYFIERVLYE